MSSDDKFLYTAAGVGTVVPGFARRAHAERGAICHAFSRQGRDKARIDVWFVDADVPTWFVRSESEGEPACDCTLLVGFVDERGWHEGNGDVEFSR